MADVTVAGVTPIEVTVPDVTVEITVTGPPGPPGSGGGGEGGVSDHGLLTGLGDDDHSQYYNQTRGDARYSRTTHTHAGVYDPAGTAASAVSAHAAAADPHPTYLTAAEGNALYAPVGSGGGGAVAAGSPAIRTGTAKRDTSRIVALFLGDSLTEGAGAITSFGNTWPQRYAQGVRTRLGLPVGGPGWKKPKQGVAGMGFTEGTVVSGSPVDAQTATGVPGSLSACGVSWDTTGATSVDVYVMDAGSSTTTIDPAVGSTITVTGQPNAVWKRTVTNPGANVVVTCNTGAILGISIHNGDETSGVEVVNLAWFGIASGTVLTNTNLNGYKQLVTLLNPDLVVVELGANDADQAVPPATLTSNLQTIVSRTLTQAPLCAPALVTPYNVEGHPTISDFSPWRAAIVAASTAIGCPLVDNVTMPSSQDDPALYHADLVHLSDAGARWMGDHAFDLLAVGGGHDGSPRIIASTVAPTDLNAIWIDLS